ncbi:carbohydrate ABC transporter permease [Pseudofrankia asymbiotica]|uniref:ABC transporter permease n=1 Tax=Pseudofrankia asymbiotica TaxID=1834516 RepID=A0A1V2II29_9ACTN|nr:carbohydrate ABC transporter permease [Pseudofrankia asymbiotica]ONH32589.1 ABC transporter permease [Pseudofrankia asymbiotica]
MTEPASTALDLSGAAESGPATTVAELPGRRWWRHRPRRWRRRPSGWHLVLIPASLLMVVPLLFMLGTSLSTREETRRFPPGVPGALHWSNFSQAWTESPFGRWLLNSAIVSVTCVVTNLVLCSLAGYAFARLRFPGSRLAFGAILATLMVPFQVLMIPTLLIIKYLGIVNSLPALIVPNLVTPFGIYLLRQFFLTLPVELEEAALIDGASRFRILRSVLLPLMGPPLSTVGVLTFLTVWNEFLWPLVVTSSSDVMTVQIGLATFQSAHFTDWPVLMAATLMSQIPVMLLFLAGQRYFVSSIANTGIK